MGPDPKKQISVSVWLDIQTNRRVLALCQEQGIKRAQFIRRAVQQAVVRAEKECELRRELGAEQGFDEHALAFLRLTQRKIEQRRKPS
jgi:hypothetical protein